MPNLPNTDRSFPAEASIDLVVSDMMTPGISGMEVLERLRAGQLNQDVPVIIITARVRSAGIEQGLAAGASDQVTKPFSPEELLLRINPAPVRLPPRSEVRSSRA